MFKMKCEQGSTLVLTVMVFLILSMLGLAILPLTVIEYKSSQNFSDFQKAYFIAEAGLEEAIAELDYDSTSWDSYSGNSWDHFEDGEYQVQVEGTGNSRLIKAYGKIGNIERKLQANIKKLVTNFNLAGIKEYSIYSQGNLYLDDITSINGGIIGAHGDIHFDSAVQAGGGAEVLIPDGKDVIPKHPLGHSKNEYYTEENFPRVDKELMDLSGFDVDGYIAWLETYYSDRIIKIDSVLEGSTKCDLDSSKNTVSYAPGAEDGILIIQNYEDVTLKGSFSGLIIVHKTEVLKIQNNSEINGMIIFTGDELEITEFHISGSSIEVNGSLICLNDNAQKGNWKLQLTHDMDQLNKLNEYLPEDYEVPPEDGSSKIEVVDWKEFN